MWEKRKGSYSMPQNNESRARNLHASDEFFPCLELTVLRGPEASFGLCPRASHLNHCIYPNNNRGADSNMLGQGHTRDRRVLLTENYELL